MSVQRSDLFQPIASPADIPLDDWLSLVAMVRERRNRLFGAELCNDVVQAIFVTLGRSAHAGGLPIKSIVDATGASEALTSRWLSILAGRNLVDELPGNWFKLSDDGRARLQQIYS
jgi:hypothetical protein